MNSHSESEYEIESEVSRIVYRTPTLLGRVPNLFQGRVKVGRLGKTNVSTGSGGRSSERGGEVSSG